MKLSIKQRIYCSFFLLVLLFVINGIASIYTLYNSKKLSDQISKVITPALENTGNLEDLLIQSKISATSWVFLRSNNKDKEVLIRLHKVDYPEMKQKLNLLLLKLHDQSLTDSMHKAFTGFEELLDIEKRIMASLNKVEKYDDHAIKAEAERLIEDEILPRTSSLMSSLDISISYMQDSITEMNKTLERSFMFLRMLITVLAVVIICLGVFLSIYMTRTIIGPIHKIRHIVSDLGKGVIKIIDHNTVKDEMGEMISSVNSLSKRLMATATFATEIGNRNFHTYFEPLSADDSLGMALVAMRDNIKVSDEKLNDAQHIAQIGSWERNIRTDKLTLSDEMFNIFDIDPLLFDFEFSSIMKFIHPDDREYSMEISRKNLYMSPIPYECRIITQKKVTKNIWIETKVVLGQYGDVEKTFGIVQDITERKRAEERLGEERELFRLVIENIPDQIYLKDLESRFILCNMPVVINAGCISQEDMKGKTDFDFLPQEIANQCFIDEQNIIKSGIPLINHEEYMTDKITGQLRWSLSTKFPLRNNAGDMIGLIGINHDITERKISEKKLEDANRELSILFNSIDEIFFSVNMTTLKVIQISPTCERIYGYKQSEFLNDYKLWLKIIHPDDKDIIANEDKIMQRGEQVNNQYRIIRKDNTVRWVESKITPTLDKNGNLIRVDGVTRDITERKKAEETLILNEKYNRNLFDQSTGGLALSRIDGVLEDINEAYAKIIGRTIEECKTLGFYEITPEKYSAEELKKLIDLEVTGRYGPYEKEFIHKDGHLVPVRLSGTILERDGTKYIWSSIEDITDAKRAEELILRSEATLETKNKELEIKNLELEQFAFVASHDLQEPLRTTSSFVNLLRQQYYGRLDEKADRYLTYIFQASDRMKVLIKDLLDYSHIGNKKELKKIECNTVLYEILADLDTAINETHADIVFDPLPVINGYPTEIKQLFQNLIMNAIKFRKKDIHPQIKISAKKIQDYWEFAFKDNGIGIDEKFSEKVFVIFQRLHTRTEYQGSGIGLSHCKKIVELHKGKIWFKSTPGEGSTFYFTIQDKAKSNLYEKVADNILI